MTTLSKRRSRIVRVRAIEHRIAAMQQSAAERRVVELVGVAQRLDDLRQSLSPSEGLIDGASLQAKGELSNRLARAEAEMRTPIRRAEHAHDEATSLRLRARAREEGAERLRGKAALMEEQKIALRQDANRPFRTPKEVR